MREELREGLEALVYNNGSKIIKNVYFKEELYEGPYSNQAPDLVLLSNYGYDLKGKTDSESVFTRTKLQGMHTQDGAFFYSSSGEPCSSIFDAKDIILDSLDKG